MCSEPSINITGTRSKLWRKNPSRGVYPSTLADLSFLLLNTCEQLPVSIVSFFAHPMTLPSCISQIAVFCSETIYRPVLVRESRAFPAQPRAQGICLPLILNCATKICLHRPRSERNKMPWNKFGLLSYYTKKHYLLTL